MLATQQHSFRDELNGLIEGIADRDLEDGAGQVVLDLLKTVDDRIIREDITSQAELCAAMAELISPAEGECRLEEGHMGPILSALRLLWAGYYREIVIEEKHRRGEVGYRVAAVSRFRETIFKAQGVRHA